MEFTEDICYTHQTYKGYEYVVYYGEHSIMAHLCGYVKIPKDHPWYKIGIKQRWFSLGTAARTLEKLTAKGKNPFIPPPLPKVSERRRYRRDYDNVPLNVHGGLTFGELITNQTKNNFHQPFTPGLWVGWDYQHAGDEMYLPKERIEGKDEETKRVWNEIMEIHTQSFPDLPKDKRWTWEEVEEDCKDAISQLIKAKNPFYRFLNWLIKGNKYI